MADGTLIFDTALDTSGLQEGADGASKKVGGLGDVAKNALGVFAGNVMTKATEAVVNFGKEALSSGMSFEQSMAKTKTLFGGTDEQFTKLSDDILRISNETGLAASGLAEAAYSAESAGVKTEDLSNMLSGSAKLAAAGFTDIDTALSATAKTMNAYGMSGEESMNKVQTVLMQTQNLGITTVGELGASLAQVTPTAAAFGVSFEQVGASLAVMTAQGTPTAQATTQLNGVIAELGKNGTTAAKNLEKAAKGTKYAGMSFAEMMNAGADLGDVLGMISDQADKDGVSMVDMFSSIEAGKAALAITAGEGENFKKSLEGMSTSADVVGEAYSTVSETLEQKTARIKNSVQNMAIGVYQMAAGPLANAADAASSALGKLMDGFNEGGFSGMGDALLGMMENAATALQNYDWAGLATSIVEKINAFIAGGGGGQFLTAATNILTSIGNGLLQMIPILLPALMNLAIYIGQQLGQLTLNALQNIGTLLSGVISTVVSWGSELAASAGEAVSTMITNVGTWMAQLPDRIWQFLLLAAYKVGYWSVTLAVNGGQAIANMINAIAAILPQLPSMVWTWLMNTIQRVVQFAANLRTKGSDSAKGFMTSIINGLKSLPEKMKTIGSNIVQGIWKGISSGWEWLTGKVSDLAGSLLKGAKDALGIHSPSRKFADEVGRFIPPGIGKGMAAAMPETLRDMKAQAAALVSQMQGAVSMSLGGMSLNAAGAGGGTTIYYDNRMEQTNNYSVPVASPSEVAKAQREALRNMIGGVK